MHRLFARSDARTVPGDAIQPAARCVLREEWEPDRRPAQAGRRFSCNAKCEAAMAMATAAAQRQGYDEATRFGKTTAAAGIVVSPSPPEPGNEALTADLARIARGDERVFERFYEATLARVFAVVRRICYDAALAEEVVEDVYVQVWREAARFDAARGVVLAWLLMMARTRALDALRKVEPAFVSADPLGLVDEPEAGDADPLGLLEALRRDSEIRAALAVLPVRERQMIALAFFRGMTHAEISAAMHCPLGTVKTAIRRALATLRARLSDGSGSSGSAEEIEDEDER
jgi:RNA polymerase sigma-70 factor (ECF subfamily)